MGSNATDNSKGPNFSQHVPEANEMLRSTSDPEIDTILDFVLDYETVEPKRVGSMEETFDDLLSGIDCDIPFNFEANFDIQPGSSEVAPRLPEFTGDHVDIFFVKPDLLQTSTSNPDFNGANATVQSLSTDSAASRGSGLMCYNDENDFDKLATKAFITAQEMKQESIDVDYPMGYQFHEPNVGFTTPDVDDDIQFLEEIPNVRRVRPRYG